MKQQDLVIELTVFEPPETERSIIWRGWLDAVIGESLRCKQEEFEKLLHRPIRDHTIQVVEGSFTVLDSDFY